ncbi:MAG TPA: asparagine synthase (glutamine-hydrolyzing), partial [Nitrospirales bacterium]|nr:asparagine synthase (glutamine-hydrolyzing) [Nitrospirales bacterium]
DDRSVALIFNGEIYNFRELRAELEVEGKVFRGHSDTEVLLALYLRDGTAMLSKLNGIFAFAIWDRRSQELLLARDAFGVKPLYFIAGPHVFAFASEIKALLPLVDTVGELDPASLHRYLSFLWCPGEGTPLKNVKKLLPGEAMVCREASVARRWQWYQLPAFRCQPADMDEAAAVGGTEAALRTAVHRQLVADVPVGAFLSGGLDSSTIVAMARERVPDIRCFTIESRGGVEEGMADDLPFARSVAKHLGVSLDVVSIDSSRMAADLEDMVYQLDEPLADPAPLNVLYISRLAREHGMKVLLSGAGGDDLFTGYRRHLALGYEHLWSWLPQCLRNGLDKGTAGLDQRRPLFRRLAKLFSAAGMDGDARLVHYFVWARESQLMELYTPEFRAAIGAESAVQPMLDFLAPMSDSTLRLERMLALEQRFYLADHNLTYTDKMSMAAGVEVRVPFLDLDLVEFASRIPPRFKQRGRVGKWVLKKVMEPYLPHEVIYRPKSGFGAPLRRWMRHELHELLGDLLSKESLRRRGMFSPVAVEQLIKENDTGKIDASYTLLSLLCIEIWCRRFLDHQVPLSVG